MRRRITRAHAHAIVCVCVVSHLHTVRETLMRGLARSTHERLVRHANILVPKDFVLHLAIRAALVFGQLCELPELILRRRHACAPLAQARDRGAEIGVLCSSTARENKNKYPAGRRPHSSTTLAPSNGAPLSSSGRAAFLLFSREPEVALPRASREFLSASFASRWGCRRLGASSRQSSS